MICVKCHLPFLSPESEVLCGNCSPEKDLAVLRAEVERLRPRHDSQVDYSISLQRAIERHCHNEDLSAELATRCPHHADLLAAHRQKTCAELAEARTALEAYLKARPQCECTDALSCEMEAARVLARAALPPKPAPAEGAKK